MQNSTNHLNNLNEQHGEALVFYKQPLIVFGCLLGLTVMASSYILGSQIKGIRNAGSNITVKGLAEKPVKATTGEWGLTAVGWSETEDDAVNKTKANTEKVMQYLAIHKIPASEISKSSVSSAPNYVSVTLPNGEKEEKQEGYNASQSIFVKSKQLDLLKTGFEGCADFERKTEHQAGCSSPEYLVDNLDAIKMSLIEAATKNARQRAEQFVKADNGSVGAMTSASQGAFYILPQGGSADDSDYGGSYDKSTIDKTVRVVITANFAIK